MSAVAHGNFIGFSHLFPMISISLRVNVTNIYILTFFSCVMKLTTNIWVDKIQS